MRGAAFRFKELRCAPDVGSPAFATFAVLFLLRRLHFKVQIAELEKRPKACYAPEAEQPQK